MKIHACLVGMLLAAASDVGALSNPSCRFTSVPGADEWSDVDVWRVIATGAPLGRLPTKADGVAVDAQARLATAALANHLTVGSRYATGRVSSLVLEEGGTYDSLYGTVTVGDAAGATGVVHFAGGAFPDRRDAYNGTSNVSYFVIGNAGAGYVTNTAGTIALREACRLGESPGGFGRYVHAGGSFVQSFGWKPFAVGVLGGGELEVNAGALNVQDLLIGGTNTAPGTAIVRANAVLAANARVSVGGYTNRMTSASLAYPTGRGALHLAGGTLALTVTRASRTDPVLQIGCWPRAWGELEGRGVVSNANNLAEMTLGFGHGRVTARAGCLDLSALRGVTNVLGCAGGGWFAEAGGHVLFPRTTATAAADGTVVAAFGATGGLALPDATNGVTGTLTGGAAGTHVFTGGVWAADAADADLTDLPGNLGVRAVWKLADAAAFASAALVFRFDVANVSTNREVALYRREGNAWRFLVRTVPPTAGVLRVASLAPRTGETWNVGVFALVERGRRLTFVPNQHTTNGGGSGKYYLWSKAANWIGTDGTFRAPREDDELVVTTLVQNAYHAAECSAYVREIRFTPGAGNMNVSHSGFRLKEGGAGLVSEVSGGVRTMWTSLYLHGAACANVTSAFYVTGSVVGRSAAQPGRLVKDGPAAFVCGTAGKDCAGATIRAGSLTFKTAATAGLNFHFEGTAASAYLALSNNLTLAGATFTGTADLPRTKHGVTDGGRGFTLAITGTPATASAPYTGGFHGATSFRFAPASDAAVFTCARATSVSTGSLAVERGTVRFIDGATWKTLAALSVSAGACVEVAADAELAPQRLTVGGVEIPPGVYATNALYGATVADWVRGGGAVCVGGVTRKGDASAWRAADGWYVFGNPSWTPAGVSSTWYGQMAVPDFAHLYFPSDARVRFRGGLLFDAFPEGAAEYDWTACTGFGITRAGAFAGRTIPVATGCAFWFMPCDTVSTNATGTVVRTLVAESDTAARTLREDVALDGTWYVNESTRDVCHAGRLSGSGTLRLTNFYETFTALGEWAFTGEAFLSQVGNDLVLKPGRVTGAGFDLHFGTGSPQYVPIVCRYAPPADDAPPLPIVQIRADGAGGVSGTGNRYGPAFCVMPGHAAHVGRLSSAGAAANKALHLFADTTLNAASRGATGTAHVVVGSVPKASYLYVYDGLDLEITNLAAAVTLDYTVETNRANEGSLVVRGTQAAGSRLLAKTPQMVPEPLAGWAGAVILTGRVWRLALDFNRLAVCRRTVGTDWQYAPTGTIEVVWTDGTPVPGTYPLLDFPSGSSASDPAKWPARLVADRSRSLALERSGTRLSVRVAPGVFPLAFHVDDTAGDDAADGLTPATAWKTIARANAADIRPGESLLLKRGGLWRDQLVLHSGAEGRPVYHGAYGTGPKPVLQGSAAAVGAAAWTEEAPGLWRSAESYACDVGNMICDHGATNGWKKWKREKLVKDYDFLYDRTNRHVYVKSAVNPGLRHASVELALDRHVVHHGNRHDAVVDGWTVRYGAAHGFGGATTRRLRIQHCDICWIGGGVLGSEVREDGSITRYGNGIEWWGSSADNVVVSNRLWEIYDAALTDQSDVGQHTNLVWAYNVVWNAEYAYEHFNRSADYDVVDITVAHNTFVDSGRGWGNVQRPDPNSAPLMIWYSQGPTVNFDIRDNVLAFSVQQGARMTTDWHTRVTLRNNLWWLADGKKLFRLVNTWYDFAGLVALGLGEGSVFADPLFRDAAAHDYRLRRASPARGLASDGGTAGAFPLPARFPSAVFLR